MIMDNNCGTCKRKILRHSFHIFCNNCKIGFHIKCLPNMSTHDYEHLKDWTCIKCVSIIFPFNQLEDENDFIDALSELWYANKNFSFSQLSDKIFNPFEFNEGRTALPIDAADPDIQFFNDYAMRSAFSHSDYYFIDDFISKKKAKSISSNSFSLIHMNIRSAPSHFQEFEAFLTSLETQFQIIALSETWFSDITIDTYGLIGYSHEYNYRSKKRGGGVSLYIKDDIEYARRTDLSIFDSNFESCFIEIPSSQFTSGVNIIIGVLYRPPNTDVDTFNDIMNVLLSKLKNEKQKKIYLSGDYNINLLNIENHISSSEFLEMMFSHSFFPLINRPTRITTSSATLIDNIFCNSISSDFFNAILYSEISDHFPICCFDYSSNKKETKNERKSRNYSHQKITEFKKRLSQIEWANVLNCNDAQEAFSLFHEKYMKLYDECFPVLKIKSTYKNRKPWLTDALKSAIKKKNRLYLKSIKNKTMHNELEYSRYKKILKKLMSRAEKDHYEDIFKKNIHNLKKSWSIIKEIINRKKSTSSNSKFLINGSVVEDNQIICEGFNNFYINVGPTLASKIPQFPKSPKDYLPPSNSKSIFLEPATKDEVEKLIALLKDSSAGWDDIQAKILKITYHSYLPTIVHLLNLSLEQGVFPNQLKLARVVALYKADDPMIISNYRPVSILPVLSKLFERVMYNRLLNFINENKLLYKYQFGFREEHGTDIALIVLIDKIMQAFNEGEIVLGVFLDLSKAFDTVNHEILLTKLYHYGVRGIPYEWFKSYMSNRQQFVSYNNHQSKKKTIKCGVPQGSILGPLLFLIYINDMVTASHLLFSILFADDTNVFVTGKTLIR